MPVRISNLESVINWWKTVSAELFWTIWLSNWVRFEIGSLRAYKFATTLSSISSDEIKSLFALIFSASHCSDALIEFSAFVDIFGFMHVLQLLRILPLRETFMQVMETWIFERSQESRLLQC